MNQNCSTYLKSHLEYFLFIIIILLAICIRYQISFRGYNPDVVSYQIVSNLINEGKNVYANTNRYNYGPIWFYILSIIDQISTLFNSNYLSFRHLIALFLAFVDVGISLVLIYYKRPKAAIFFLFSPISIIITGYHSQFSNLAILIALSSSLILKKFKHVDDVCWTRLIFFCLLLAVSLIVKHVFIFFPVWLFFKSKRWDRRLALLTIPIGIFIVSFIPYCWDKGAIAGIIRNVITYSSWNNAPFYSLFIPNIFKIFISPKVFFFISMIITGFFYRKKNVFESMIFYCVALLIFSSAVANQYLAIPIIFTSLYVNFFTILYNILGFIFLAMDWAGLHIKILWEVPLFRYIGLYGYYILITILFLGWITSIDKIRYYLISILKKNE